MHQRQRARNLVGEIERAALGLGCGEASQDRPGDDEKRDRAFEDLGRAAALAQPDQAGEFALQVRFEAGQLVAQFHAGQVALGSAARIALPAFGEEGFEQRLDPLRRIGLRVRRLKLGDERLVLRPAEGELLRPRSSLFAPDVAAEHLGLDARRRRALGEAEAATQRVPILRPVVERLEGLRETLRLFEQLVEIERPGVAGDAIERRLAFGRGAERRHRATARIRHQGRRLALVHDLEVRRDVGLEREELQQPLAEGVQSLDLEPARRFDRSGEQLPGEGERRRTGPAGAGRDNVLRERLVVEARPFGERHEDAAGHIGGGGLGEGQAEDLRRLRPSEQQPQHALGQHMRLAAAGIGGNPGRAGRIGGERLMTPQQIRNVEPLAHQASPAGASAAPPASDHSFTRAR